MFNNINSFMCGILFSVIYILICFGLKIEEKSIPKIKVNIWPFIKNSSIYIFDKHIHHWLVALIVLLILQVQPYRNAIYYLLNGFFVILMVHGLLYKDRFIL